MDVHLSLTRFFEYAIIISNSRRFARGNRGRNRGHLMRRNPIRIRHVKIRESKWASEKILVDTHAWVEYGLKRNEEREREEKERRTARKENLNAEQRGNRRCSNPFRRFNNVNCARLALAVPSRIFLKHTIECSKFLPRIQRCIPHFHPSIPFIPPLLPSRFVSFFPSPPSRGCLSFLSRFS